MESVLGRYRNLIILVGVLFLQVLGLAVQVKRNGAITTANTENTRLIRVWAVGAVTPFERGLMWIRNGTGSLWHDYIYLRGVRAENRQLKEQIEQMRLEQVRLREDAEQAHRLQTLLAFKEQFVSKTVAAQVIGSSASDLSRIIYIDKGEDDGLKPDMAVITADGIVGKVLRVFKNPSVAQVLLIDDQSSGVGVILEKSRLQGVLRGTPNGEVVLERVMSDEQVPLGETVLTSGGDQIFPKGLPVGVVGKVSNGKDLFLQIRVKPSVNLNRLEEVLVLTEQQERQAVADDKTRVRAADILAQRLPSVPAKPPVDATKSQPGAPNAASGSSTQAPAQTGVASAPKNPSTTNANTHAAANVGQVPKSPISATPASTTSAPTTAAQKLASAANGSPQPKAPATKQDAAPDAATPPVQQSNSQPPAEQSPPN